MALYEGFSILFRKKERVSCISIFLIIEFNVCKKLFSMHIFVSKAYLYSSTYFSHDRFLSFSVQTQRAFFVDDIKYGGFLDFFRCHNAADAQNSDQSHLY